ncbi:hypothetical protein [Burkholderia cepacia]|uniref:hypothetical protein n=1 Tax=Burkholderia cepacia TaxID=292 RepID=UPI002ABE2C2D|nr:hypothetical protein [Burkholderia cepacia]
MDYTRSPDFVIDADTGFRRHDDTKPIATVQSADDTNSIIWSMMEVVKFAGLEGAKFDPKNPDTYRVFLSALKQLHSGPAGGDNVGFIQRTSGATLRTMQDKARETISILDNVGRKDVADPANAEYVRQAAQEIITWLGEHGGGCILYPAAVYAGDVSVPLIVPSGVEVRFDRGAELVIIPSTIPYNGDRPYPLAAGGVFVTGDPHTGLRAGQVIRSTDGLAAIDPSTVVRDVWFTDVVIRAPRQTGQLPVGYWLNGISNFFAHGGGMRGCIVRNLPNTGLYALGCKNFSMMDVEAQECGFGGTDPASRNGISSIGHVDLENPAMCSESVHLVNVRSHRNRDEGVQYGLVAGNILADISCHGNGHLGIEGDSSFSIAATAAALGYEIPGTTIMTGIDIDGRKPDGTLGRGGISGLAGNEGRFIISSAVIRNTQGDPGVAIGQQNGGVVEASGLHLENVSPGPTYHQVQIQAADVSLSNVRVRKPGVTNSNAAILLFGHLESISTRNIDVDAGLTNAVSVLLNTPGSLKRAKFHDVNTAGVVECGIDVRINAPQDIEHLSFSDCDLLNVNSSGVTDKTAIRIRASSAVESVVVRQMTLAGVVASYAGRTYYPLGLQNLPAGAVQRLHVVGCDLGQPELPWGRRLYDIASAVSVDAMHDVGNRLPGRRIVYVESMPTSGEAVLGDKFILQPPRPAQPEGWLCSVSGTIGQSAVLRPFGVIG